MKRLFQKIRYFNADWKNHLVGFIVTLAGILIALQLQDWQETKKEKERIRIAMEAIKLELQANKETLQVGAEVYNEMKKVSKLVFNYYKNDSLLLVPVGYLDSLKTKNGELFSDFKIVKKTPTHDVVKWSVSLNFFPPKLYFDNWEALKLSGLLHLMPHDRLTNLMRVYGELNRNYSGIGQDELLLFIRNHPLTNLNYVKEYSQMTGALGYEYESKLHIIEPTCREIEKY